MLLKNIIKSNVDSFNISTMDLRRFYIFVMKFTEQLSTHLTPEWRLQYIDYENLKSMLYVAVKNAPSIGTAYDLRAVHNYYANFDEKFFQKCQLELTKVNTFFAEKLAEATRKYAELMLQLNACIEQSESKGRLSRMDLTAILSGRKLKDLKFAFSEFYLSLVLLQNYQSLNHTGFRKILKKHDKLLRNDMGNAWFNEHVDSANFYINRDLRNLINDTENTFTSFLEGGNRSKAMKRLRVPPLEEIQGPWVTFRVGYYLGAFVVLTVAVIISVNTVEMSHSQFTACLYLNRGPFYTVIFLFLIGINVYGWRLAGVNHILIFEIEPRNHLTHSHILEMAAAFGCIWALCVLGYLHNRSLGLPVLMFPFLQLFLQLAFLINPLHILNYGSRQWLLRLLGRVVAAPFFPVGFADFWMGDQLNSLVLCVLDYEYILCFYMTNWSWYNIDDAYLCREKDKITVPIICCLPAWFRFAQCLRRYHDTREVFPYLVNAGKYASSFPVILFKTLMTKNHDSYASTFESPYVWCYFFSYTVQSIYCYSWDVLKDFGIFAKFSGENIFLRDQIIYPAGFYYFTIIENFILRFFWIISFTLVEHDLVTDAYMSTISGFLDIFRRYIWNYFRLENEHLFNAGKFRAVRDISLAIIEPTEQIKLQRMMDEVNGVENRHKSD